MYNTDIVIYGQHAKYMKELTAPLSADIKKGFFNRNVDVFLCAPIIGFLFNRRVTNQTKNREINTKVFADTVIKEQDRLLHNYRLLALLYDKKNTCLEERQARAFRYDNNPEKRKYFDEIFESYVYGGIEVLYENLLSEGTTLNDRINNLYSFINAFNGRYYQKMNNEFLDDFIKTVGD
ncbi:MAG: hypothetical protein PHN26_04505 [Eubacteriaceae bacterium]|nr:hypothetical protein [Eubacteriaceae bacterium]